ncbi:MAG: helix-turn-helix transcriptional regulator [Cellvibrionaceae bacterium]
MTVLLEREEPLNLLLAMADKAKEGRGSVALISGEAGIGKTSLLTALRSKRGLEQPILWGASDALFTPRPLGPLHDMASSLTPKIRSLLAEGSKPATLYSLLIQEIETSANGTVFIFEDSHWADYATLDLLKYLGRRISMLPALIIISFRDDEVINDHPLTRVLGELPSSHTQRIDLLPFSKEAIETLGIPTGYSLEELYNVTGGNPFFVTELLSCHHNPEAIIPASIKDAVGSRLSRLSLDERNLLETISVIPGSIPINLLKTLAGEAGDTLAMACVGRNILVQEVNGSLRFRHELSRLATLARISSTKQKILHAKVLKALLKRRKKEDAYSTLDRLVHHAAGAFDSAQVLEIAPIAAKTAASLGAHSESAAHLATALRFVNDAEPELAAQLYENWAYEAGLALRIDDEVLEARRHAISLWRALKRPEKVGENLRWLSRLHWYRGEASQATHYADEAIRVLESTPTSAEHGMAYSLRSQFHMLNDRMEEAIFWGEKALSLAEEYDNVDVKIHALNNVGTSKIFRNNAEGIAELEESLSLALEEGLHEHAARVYTNLAEYAVDFRNFELAEKILSEGIAFDNQHDLYAWTYYLLGRLASLRLEQGRLRDAETITSGVLKSDRLTLIMSLPALSILAKTQMRLGHESAINNIDKALTDALATDELQYIIPIRLTLLEYAWLDNKKHLAKEQLQYLNEVGVNGMHYWSVGEAAIWAHRFHFPMNQEFFSDLPAPYAKEIEGDFKTASRLWSELGMPYSAAIALMNTQDKMNIQSALVEAQEILENIEATKAVLKIRNIASDLGILNDLPRTRRGPYRAARNHPLGLTKREQQILKLITKGASNKDIAQTLSRSQRTVEHHVSSILTKLNSNTRMEAMLRVHNEPWLLPEEEKE